MRLEGPSLAPLPPRPHVVPSQALPAKGPSSTHTSILPLRLSLRVCVISTNLPSFTVSSAVGRSIMFRPTSSAAASRALWRSLNSAAHSPLHRASGPVRQHLRSQLCTLSQRPRGPAMVKPLVSQTLQFGRRQATTGNRGPVDNIDKKYEEHIQQQKLHPDPASVSSTSTTNPVFESGGGQSAERDTEMLAGVKHDLVCCHQWKPAPKTIKY